MKRQIFFFLILFLVSCSPLNQESDPGRKGGDQEGEPIDQPTDEDLEGLSWIEFLHKCKPEIDTPDNIVDVIVDILPEKIRKIYIPGNVRKCAKKKIEDVHNKICKTREELERRRRRARSDTEKSSIQNSMHQLDLTQWKFNERLRELAEDTDKRLIKLENKEAGKSGLGRIANQWSQDEVQAWRDIFDVQSYRECGYFSEDDD